MIISVFLPGLGCSKTPCIYCDQEIMTSTKAISSEEDIKKRISETIQEHLASNVANIKFPIEVAFYASNFTAIDFALQKNLLKHVQSVFEDSTGKSAKNNLKIRISTRPDFVKRQELLDLKIRFNLHTVEIGVQSMDDDVLFLSNREYNRADIVNASKIIKSIGLELSCHQMIGLPGSNHKLEIKTAKDIIKLKPDYVRIHPTLILKDTILEKMFLSGKYVPLQLEEAIEITEKVVDLYREANVKIIRIGLHPSEIMLDKLVAGPWHPAFRELVEGKYLLVKVSHQLSKFRGEKVVIRIAPKDETYIRGKNNNNFNNLLKLFDLKDIQLLKDPEIPRGTLVADRL